MIEVHDLTIQYASGSVFGAADAVFDTGMITGVIGRNGSGKSTILKALAGQIEYRGSISIEEKECRDLSDMTRARLVAYLPQQVRSVNLDVRTLTEHGRYPHHGSFRRMSGEDRDHIDKALEITGMSEFRDRNLSELSGGERQRAYLAMVIAQDTPMILLDEPTTYMDHLYREEFYRILRSLAQAGKGIIMVCHDLEQSFAYSDRIHVMSGGMLRAGMTPGELCAEEEIIRANFGVAIKPSVDNESLYPYVMKKL